MGHWKILLAISDDDSNESQMEINNEDENCCKYFIEVLDLTVDGNDYRIDNDDLSRNKLLVFNCLDSAQFLLNDLHRINSLVEQALNN